MPTRPRQHLIFDADDTLWENNIVFEGVIADFIAWLDHPGLTAAEVRAVMDGIERTGRRCSSSPSRRRCGGCTTGI